VVGVAGTTVGATSVKVMPDTGSFGPQLQLELGRLSPVVKVGLDLAPTTPIKTKLDLLGANRQVKFTASLLGDAAVRTKLDTLGADRTVKIRVDLDTASRDRVKQELATGLTGSTLKVGLELDRASVTRVKNQLALEFKKNLVVKVVPELDYAATVSVRTALANLAQNRNVVIDVSEHGAATASAVIDRAARDRRASISVGVDSGNSDRALGGLLGSLTNLKAVAVTSLPTLASIGQALYAMAPAAALAAPAIAGVGSALAALKIGTTGLGAAFKAAFSTSTTDATKAISSAKAIESAQRAVATAVRGVTTAQQQLQQATQGVSAAQRQQAQAVTGVKTAEQDLTNAQRAAVAAQQALTSAREQGRRELESMNNSLADAKLSQQQDILNVAAAQTNLNAVLANPASTVAQRQQAQLTFAQAQQQLLEQRQQVAELSNDTAAANKKGIAGTQAMTTAQQNVASANQTVIDKQGALAAAQQKVADSNQNLANAQQKVADAQQNIAVAQQNVADATEALAQSQQSAALQTSALSKAMGQLSPNARAFVNEVVALAPAWHNLQLGVQDTLLAGIGTRVGSLARQVLPTLRTGLVGMAGDLNLMGKNALTAFGNLQKSGQLKQIFAGATAGMRPLMAIPGQVITAFGQITVAAQPQFNRLTSAVGSLVDRVAGKLSGLFSSGALGSDIKVAVDLFKQLMQLVGSVLTVVKNVLSAAATAGTGVLGVLGQTVAQIAKISAMPQVQAALKTIFGALAALGKAIAGVFGSLIQAALPLLAALAPAVTAVAVALGPVLKQLATALGGALLPLINALAPVLQSVLLGAVQVVAALTPLLAPIGALLTAIVRALAPVVTAVVSVIVQLVAALVGPLTSVINTLIPVVNLVGSLISGMLAALLPVLKPLLAVVSAVAGVFANVFAAAVRGLMPILMSLIPVVTGIVTLLARLYMAVLTPLAPVLTQVGMIFATLIGAVLKLIAPVITVIVNMFMRLLPALMPLIPVIGQLMTAVLALLVPLLNLLMVVLIPLITVVEAVSGVLIKVLAAAINFLIPIVVTVISWITKFVTMIVNAVTSIITWFTHLFDVLLGHSIIPDIVNGIVGWFTNLWHTVESIFSTIAGVVSSIWSSLWNGIKTVASAAWGLVKTGFNAFSTTFKTAFGLLRDGIGLIWGGVKALFSAPIKFLVQTVYDQGIRTVWNATAGKIGLGNLPNVALPKGFASGGIMPGYTPGKDVHLVPSVSGPVALSGGEAIMRPEWTRAVGPDYVHAMNAAARTGGVQAIRDALGLQGFDGGGIFGGIAHAASSLAGDVSHVVSKGVDWARQGIADLAEAAFKPVRSIIDQALGGSPKGSWGDSARLLPETTITKAIAFIRGKEATTTGGAGLSALHVAERFKGVPYLWGGESPGGFDCSGLMQYAYQNGPHIAIPRTSQVQQSFTKPVSAAAAQPGDLVFFGQPAHHVGMFVHPGTMLDAPHTGTVVREEGLGAYTSIGRVPGITQLSGPGLATGAPPTVAQAAAKAMLPQFGWGMDQWPALQQLWTRESGWNYRATNPTSGAYGIAQALPPSKMAVAGLDWLTNPATQEKWGLGYILSRYGSPANAWAHELQLGWYKDGGFPQIGGLSIVGEEGPELIRTGGPSQVYPADVTARMARQMAGLVSGTAAAPGSVRSATTVTNGGPRTLEYHATTREVASRQSVLDALAHEELLHRSVVGG
jgi:phage-related protein